MDRPLYLGIDLGTTNSAACVFDGEKLHVVRGPSGDTLTPSVVRIDGRSNVSVGTKAFRFLHKDPENTRGEFKRLMGSTQTCRFQAANLDKKPDELAALVLGALRKDVAAQFGVEPAHAVVAVPALFELPQIQATSEAARLAGFLRIETIQEPVASALASGWSSEESRGAWLVYDLGGGTFDASLLESQEGLLRVVGHDGDNFLGGRDFDLAIVDWLIDAARRSTGVAIERSNPAHRMLVSKLKAAAEEAKIELSRGAEQTTIALDELTVDGNELSSIEEVLSRAELERITAPLVERSVRVCERLLRAHGVKSLERVVLVGGPTAMPSVRARLEAAFGAPFGTGLDPMLLVSQGAALFAATVALDSRAVATEKPAAGPRVWLQFPAMTPDTSPWVVGRLLDESPRVNRLRFTRRAGSFQTEWVTPESDSTFSAMLSLERRASNTFAIELELDGGKIVPASPPELTLVHGLSIGEPPLARTIGIALADDSVAVYFPRGTPLPMRKSFTHRTVESVSPSAADYALRVPIVQGDFPFAHLCRLVGVIQIPASALKAPLPADSVIELSLEVDRGGALTARATLPAQGLVFDRVDQLVAPQISIESMEALATELEQRAAALRFEGFRGGNSGAIAQLHDFDQNMAQVRRDLAAARGGEQDAAEKARRVLIDCDGLLGDLEAQNAWPELTARVYEEHALAVHWLERHGTDQEKRALSQAIAFFERGLRARNSREIERQLGTIRRLRASAFFRDPMAWSWALDSVSGRLESCTDPAKAQVLVRRGRTAESAGKVKELERIVREIWSLLPSDDEERSLGFDSGVR